VTVTGIPESGFGFGFGFGFGPQLKIFLGPPSKGGPAKNFYTKLERLSWRVPGLGPKGLICTFDM
jgi:hypothetical protein